MKGWTKLCKCGSYMPDEYDLCDVCLLQEYELYSTGRYDALDHYGYDRLYPEEAVLKALREARAGKRKGKVNKRKIRRRSNPF